MHSDAGYWLASSAVNWRTLQGALENSQGNRVIFVDTCHSSGTFNQRLIKDHLNRYKLQRFSTLVISIKNDCNRTFCVRTRCPGFECRAKSSQSTELIGCQRGMRDHKLHPRTQAIVRYQERRLRNCQKGVRQRRSEHFLF